MNALMVCEICGSNKLSLCTIYNQLESTLKPVAGCMECGTKTTQEEYNNEEFQDENGNY